MTKLVFELFGRDASATRVFKEVGQAAEGAGKRLKGAAKDADTVSRSFNPLQIALTGVHRALVQNVGAMAKAAAAAGGLASTAVTLAPFLIKAGQEVVAVGKAALGAAPALLGMGAAGGVALATLKLGFSGFGAAIKAANTPAELEKVNEALANLHPEARKAAEAVRSFHPEVDKLKKSIQGQIFKGLATDIKATGAALLANATPGMVRFGGEVNKVIRDLLRWGSSTAGIKATKELTNATATGMARLAPEITRVVTSFGNMIGRIAQVSVAAGASGLGGILDWLADRMDRVNAASVSTSLAELRNKYDSVKDAVMRVVEAIKEANRFYQEHRTEIGLVMDALSLLAIAFGGPVVAAAAAVGLIVRHWDDLKAAWQAVSDFFTKESGPAEAAGALSRAWETVKPGLLAFWEELKAKVGPVVAEIWDKIKNKLIPAVGNLIEAIAPFAKAWLEAFGPTIVTLITAIGEIISGLVDVVSGAINTVAGLLSGDWSRAWEGAKQIASGAGQMIAGAWKGTAGNVIDTAGRLAGGVNSNLNTIPREVNTHLTATDHASGVAEQLRLRYSYIPRSVTTVITAIQRTVQGNAAGAIMGAGGIIGMAPGGVLSRMSASTAAIVKPNTWRVIGDRASGDEAFIPLNQSGRSIAILTEAARRMGFTLFNQGAGQGELGGLGRSGLSSLPSVNPLTIGGGGRREPIVIEFRSGGSPFEDALFQMIRHGVRRGGGDVQVVLGRG